MKKRFLTLFITLFLIIIGLFFTGLFFVYVNFQSVTDSNNVFDDEIMNIHLEWMPFTRSSTYIK